jgi:hypothetical protein
MLRKLAVVMAVCLGVVATMPIGAMARAGGGVHGSGGWGGGHWSGGHGGFGGHSFVGHSFVGRPGFSHFAPGGAFVNRGGAGHPFVGHHVIGNGRFAWIGHRRVEGQRIYGFIPGIGYGYYWYYDDCLVMTDYGWSNMCGYDGYGY